jgi:hypothetical protein
LVTGPFPSTPYATHGRDFLAISPHLTQFDDENPKHANLLTQMGFVFCRQAIAHVEDAVASPLDFLELRQE